MSIIAPPTHTPPDEVDALLRDYFRSEMPEQWPALKLPAARLRPQRQSLSARTRSLLALAASVAFLVGGAWYLSATPTQFAVPVPGVGADPMGSAKNLHPYLRDHVPGGKKAVGGQPPGR